MILTWRLSSNHPGDADYTTGSFRAIFPSGTLKVTVFVPTLRDNLAEDSEHFRASLSLAFDPGNVIIGSPYIAFVTIIDATRMYFICMCDNSMTELCLSLCNFVVINLTFFFFAFQLGSRCNSVK